MYGVSCVSVVELLNIILCMHACNSICLLNVHPHNILSDRFHKALLHYRNEPDPQPCMQLFLHACNMGPDISPQYICMHADITAGLAIASTDVTTGLQI